MNNFLFDWYQENNILIHESVGFDEVGRGPLAGPVVSAAVWISNEFSEILKSLNIKINDSKKMPQKARKKIVEIVNEYASKKEFYIKFAIGLASEKEIDEINILKASLLSMKRAFQNLKMNNISYALIDGNKPPDIAVKNVITIIKGDAKILSIAIASILAKEYRDNLMRNLAKNYPHYDWEHNVGYPTQKHLDAIKNFGITKHHRMSFSPIKNFQLKLF